MTIRAIRFRQSGGFTGIVRGCELSPELLGAADRRALESQLRDRRPAEVSGASPARDLTVYEIDLDTDAGVVRLEFDEMNVPTDLAALVQLLIDRSRPTRP